MQNRNSTGRIIWREIYPIIIFFGAELLVEIGFIVVFIVKMMNDGSYGPDMDVQSMNDAMLAFVHKYLLYITLIRSLIIIPIYVFFMKRDRNLDILAGRDVNYTSYNKKWLLLLPIIGVLAAFGFNHVIDMTGVASISKGYQEVTSVVYTGNLFIELLTSAIAAPLVEELLFRGLIYKRLRGFMGVIPCMLISSAAFGIIHGNIVQFIYAFLLGILLAYVYEKFKTVWAPIIFHAGANFIATLYTELTPDITVNLKIGIFMLITVAELAVTFLLLKLIDVKVNRTIKTGEME